MMLRPPWTPRELHRMLALGVGAATIPIGITAGGTTYVIETRRTERAALDLVSEATRHFGPSAMQILDDGVGDGHRALRQLLDRNRFVGIRVFDRDARLAYETWADVAASLAESTASPPHAWPAAGTVHRNRIRFADEEMIQVVLPLTANDGLLLGYLEGIYRLDQEALRHQREPLRNSVFTVAGSVLATASAPSKPRQPRHLDMNRSNSLGLRMM